MLSASNTSRNLKPVPVLTSLRNFKAWFTDSLKFHSWLVEEVFLENLDTVCLKNGSEDVKISSTLSALPLYKSFRPVCENRVRKKCRDLRENRIARIFEPQESLIGQNWVDHRCSRILQDSPGKQDMSGSPSSSCGPSRPSEGPAAQDLMEAEVQQMIHGEGYQPKPLRSWRKCPFIQASRKKEFRPVPDGVTPEIRHLPESVRTALNGCKLFQPQQIAEYNRMLQRDGKLVSGVEHNAKRERVKPGRLYHKFDSLCALATSKAGRLLLLQHRVLNHVFYAIAYDPAHKLYIEWLNMYERRWCAVSETYGKEDLEPS